MLKLAALLQRAGKRGSASVALKAALAALSQRYLARAALWRAGGAAEGRKNRLEERR